MLSSGTSTKSKCLCDCGRVVEVNRKNLVSGASAGCRKCCSGAGTPRKLPSGEAAFNDLYSHYKCSAKARNIAWDLSKEEAKILFLQHCAYCGLPPRGIWPALSRVDMNGYFTYTGIDRVDSTAPYVENNCVPCCKTCNYMKRTLSFEEFKAHILRIAAHLEAM